MSTFQLSTTFCTLYDCESSLLHRLQKMPDIDEIIEILRRNADDARERIRHILEEEGVQEVRREAL